MTKRASNYVGAFLIIGIIFYYRWQWKTLFDFVVTIDHGDDLFGDFISFYFPMAQKIIPEQTPVDGYYYSAFFAILISPLGFLSIEQAKLIWGIMQVLFVGLLALVGWLKMPDLTRGNKTIFIFLLLTSFPLLHNLKWGQVSVFITVCVLIAIWLYQENHYQAAGVFLAFAVSIKYYPIIFIVYPLFRRNYRFLIAFALSTIFFFAIVPSVVLGSSQWVGFEKMIGAKISNAKFAFDVNSQYFGHVILRIFPFEEAPFRRKILSITSQWMGILIALSNICIIWLMQRSQKILNSLLLSAGLLFLSFPFVIQTSWPHYFVYLPFCQIVLVQIAQLYLSQSGKLPVLTLIFLSCGASSIFVFSLFPGWYDYNNWGILFFSNLLLLFAYYTTIFYGFKKDRIQQ